MRIPAAIDVFGKIGDLVDQIGAYAGFAAFIGLALLALLYFAQARELKRLREWAGRMPERVGDVNARVQPARPGQPPRPAAAQNPATAARSAGTAATPAGAARPAAAAAGTGAAAGAAAAAVGTAGAAKPIVPGQSGSDGARVAAAGAAAPGARTPPGAAAGGPQNRPPRPGAGSARLAGEPPSRRRERPLGAVIAAVVAVVAVVAAVAYAVFGMGGDDTPKNPTATGESQAQATSGTKTTDRSTTTSAAVPKSEISVVVLNGTSVNGLAKSLSDKLKGEGFAMKDPADSPDKARSATLIMYAPGKRAQALRVARSIGRGADSVQAVDAANAAASKGAAVTVVIGADQQATGQAGSPPPGN